MLERIAGISLSSVLILLTLLTVARGALNASRVAVFRALSDLLESVILAVVLVFLLLRPFAVQSYFIPSASMHPTLWEGDHLLVNKFVYRTHPPERGDIVVFRAPPEASPDEKEFIKRIVGLPGDTISVEAGYVTVAGMTYTPSEVRACLEEPRSVEALRDASEPPLRLTGDALWLGDRRVTPEEFARRAGRPGASVHIEPGRILRNGTVLLESYVAEDAQYDMPPRLVPPGHLFVMGDNRNDSQDSHVWGMLARERVIGRADLIFWPVPHLRRLEPQ